MRSETNAFVLVMASLVVLVVVVVSLEVAVKVFLRLHAMILLYGKYKLVLPKPVIY
jgi:hypothetical protein